MWVGHEKRYTRNTFKVKRSKVKVKIVMRRSSTKTSNISCKRHSVVEMHLYYRKSMSPERMTGQIFDWKFLNSCFCACTVKKSSKHSENVFRKKNSYSSVTGNGGHRSERRGQIIDRKLVSRRFCACAVKIGPKLAYCVVKSPKFLPLYGQSQSLKTAVFYHLKFNTVSRL